MQEKYRNALAEIDEILNLYDDESKIPEDFKKFVKENKSLNYKVNIDGTLSLKEQNILHETKVVLAVIYEEYLANESEKQEFLEFQRNKAFQIEEEKRKKFDPNKIFENSKEEKNEKVESGKIAEIKKENFISKIINKMKMFFRRKE